MMGVKSTKAKDIDKTKHAKHGQGQGIKLLFVLTSVVILFIAVYVGIDGYGKANDEKLKDNLEEHTVLKGDNLELFLKFDVNSDQVISAQEFEALMKYITSDKHEETETSSSFQVTEKTYDPEIDELLRLKAKLTPLDKSSMSQTKKNPSFGSPNFMYSSEFQGLVDWKSPNQNTIEVQAQEFNVFLPPDKKNPVLGQPYWLIAKQENADTHISAKYNSPSPQSEMEYLLLKLLRAFHPQPFVNMRFPPQGGIAVLRAEGPIYYEICFRFHCEFQLNKPPRKPFWFTPSQFRGHVIISRDATHVREFHLYVPNTEKLNVDMEWQTDGDENMEVDIGFLPLMELKQIAPSSPVHLKNSDGTILDRRKMWEKGTDVELVFDKVVWRNEINSTVAYKELEKEFFPFKQVDYLPFADAFTKAIESNKPVHQVVLWGALDDQSC